MTGLRLPTRPRGRTLGNGREVNGLASLANLDEIGDSDIEDLCEIVEHLEARVSPAAFKIQHVPVGDPARGKVLLREPRTPPGAAEVPAYAQEVGGEVHAASMRLACSSNRCHCISSIAIRSLRPSGVAAGGER